MPQPKPVTFNTLADVRAYQWVGNAWSDGPAFMAVDAFVQNVNNSIADRAEALRIMSDIGMGCGREEELSNEEIVSDYIDNL